MKKLLLAVLLGLATHQSLAWEFTTIDLENRIFSVSDSEGRRYIVSNVRCKYPDGGSLLYIHGYLDPDVQWQSMESYFKEPFYNLPNLKETPFAYREFCQQLSFRNKYN